MIADNENNTVYINYMPLTRGVSPESDAMLDDEIEKLIPNYKQLKLDLEQSEAEWDSNHKRCPDCQGTTLFRTWNAIVREIGTKFEDNVTKYSCQDCKKIGFVKDLLP